MTHIHIEDWYKSARHISVSGLLNGEDMDIIFRRDEFETWVDDYGGREMVLYHEYARTVSWEEYYDGDREEDLKDFILELIKRNALQTTKAA